MNKAFHPLIASLTSEIIYPMEDGRRAYLPPDTMSRMRNEVLTRYDSEPMLCVHLIYAFVRCHERGLSVLGKQLLQLARAGLSQTAIENVILARRTGQDSHSALPRPRAHNVSVNINKARAS